MKKKILFGLALFLAFVAPNIFSMENKDKDKDTFKSWFLEIIDNNEFEAIDEEKGEIKDGFKKSKPNLIEELKKLLKKFDKNPDNKSEDYTFVSKVKKKLSQVVESAQGKSKKKFKKKITDLLVAFSSVVSYKIVGKESLTVKEIRKMFKK